MSRVLMFGGGSGSRGLTMALSRAGHSVCRVVPAWDSGGSSKVLRERFGMLAVGDLRQALMTLAHGEGRCPALIKFMNARLSEAGPPADLRAAFDFHADGAHPLISQMPDKLGKAILGYLKTFGAQIDGTFDFRHASIGNLVLAGAFFAHGRDINQALLAFRSLCDIKGFAFHSTCSDGVELQARLRDGRWLRHQDQITRLSDSDAKAGIDRVQLINAATGEGAALNAWVSDQVDAADLILFGPGSFYTSTIAHLSVDGLARRIADAAQKVPTVLVGNILECPETRGTTLAEEIQAFGRAGVPLSHVMAHRSFAPFDRLTKGMGYLRVGDLRHGAGNAPALWVDDFEDPWSRGVHDAEKLARLLCRLPPRH